MILDIVILYIKKFIILEHHNLEQILVYVCLQFKICHTNFENKKETKN